MVIAHRDIGRLNNHALSRPQRDVISVLPPGYEQLFLDIGSPTYGDESKKVCPCPTLCAIERRAT